MKRKALIIGAPGEKHKEGYLPGAHQDIIEYKSFLLSALGGGWFESEIAALENPSPQDVRREIENLKRADYSIAIFSGHGCFDSNVGSIRLQVQPGREIGANELKQGASKHTLLLDCCRVVVPSRMTEDRMLRTLLAKAYPDPAKARRCFESWLDRCPTGIVTTFACAHGETAQDRPEGGLYLSSLLKGAHEWRNNERHDTRDQCEILTLVAAHNRAEPRVIEESGGRRHPRIEMPRSTPYFPVAIAA